MLHRSHTIFNSVPLLRCFLDIVTQNFTKVFGVRRLDCELPANVGDIQRIRGFTTMRYINPRFT